MRPISKPLGESDPAGLARGRPRVPRPSCMRKWLHPLSTPRLCREGPPLQCRPKRAAKDHFFLAGFFLASSAAAGLAVLPFAAASFLGAASFFVVGMVVSVRSTEGSRSRCFASHNIDRSPSHQERSKIPDKFYSNGGFAPASRMVSAARCEFRATRPAGSGVLLCLAFVSTKNPCRTTKARPERRRDSIPDLPR